MAQPLGRAWYPLGKRMGSQCDICEQPTHHPVAVYCKRCRKLLDRVDMRGAPRTEARVEALKDAWDGEIKKFRCHYSYIPLVEGNPKDPRYLTFDHRTPGDEQDIVVSAAVINNMKSDMCEDEFWAMIRALADSGGQPVSENLFRLRHWRR